MIINLSPLQAWELMQQQPDAVLIDVRTKFEHSFIGHPVGAVHVAWKELPDWLLNPDFVPFVIESVPGRDTPILLLCRSGQRSLEAANALQQVGYTQLINIEGGFEGPLDDDKHRNSLGGWRFHGLPWQQN
ncbi:MAG: rhodanese-like domain-containing protein [Methylovulum sp.]|uniref:rhodanese-like domain-containing protein n=1 Tax=Methylovulum sp. TaxID=1916980 RepID=UPI00263980B3|nr:rhodanese-like domain-containing protein [Methylovulum sp.]MDD2723484.1 rhodanese-like domain-containing protein [Methylovulum sp.]MDD5124526.1 rhodanese-like domain-containing protein [Methylovulum sp.]